MLRACNLWPIAGDDWKNYVQTILRQDGYGSSAVSWDQVANCQEMPSVGL